MEVVPRPYRDEAPSTKFVTCVVRIRVPRSVPEAELAEWFKGIGEAQRAFPGFVSRRIVELPTAPGEARDLAPLLKFAGPTTTRAYARMRAWVDSDEVRYWKARAADLGVLAEHEMVAGPVGMITVPAAAASANDGPPPKWRMCVLIEFWVFSIKALNDTAGTGLTFRNAVGSLPVALIIYLVIVVPVIVYLALPLTLAVPVLQKWVARRSPSTNVLVRTIENGFELFTPDEPPPPLNDAVKRRFALLERKLEALRVAGLRDRAALEDALAQGYGGATPTAPRLRRGTSDDRAAHDRHAVHSPFNRRRDTADLEAQDEGDENGCDMELGSDAGVEPGGVAIEGLTPAAATGEVTIVGRHSVRWECVSQFEDWCAANELAMRARSKDRFLGLDVFQEAASDAATRRHVCVFRFAALEAAREWLKSDDRERFLAQLGAYVDAPSDYDTLDDGAAAFDDARTGVADAVSATPAGAFFGAVPRPRRDNDRGERNLFGDVLMGDVRSAVRPPQPSLYKVSILITVGLFLVSWPTAVHASPAVSARLPPYLSTLVLTSINVVLNVYFGSPLLYFFFSAWLRRPPKTNRPGTIMKILVAGFPSNRSKVVALLAYLAALVLGIVL
ncbi:hypothetical protein M885DRAFT_562657 [Pelagophyceae sp. CCMP2097]|nr:hypothetical protein M885DRAFT_562657 [Pelagophyceae sp. CCMP2097]